MKIDLIVSNNCSTVADESVGAAFDNTWNLQVGSGLRMCSKGKNEAWKGQLGRQ